MHQIMNGLFKSFRKHLSYTVAMFNLEYVRHKTVVLRVSSKRGLKHESYTFKFCVILRKRKGKTKTTQCLRLL